MATAIYEGVPVPASVPNPVIRETSLVAGFGIGANVFAFFDSVIGELWASTTLGLLALFFTTIGVHSALRKADGAVGRLFLWSFLPPTILFCWIPVGLVTASIAGVITWVVLDPMVEGVRRAPERHRERIALWLAIAGLVTVHAGEPLAPVVILGYVLWATHSGWSRRFVAATVIATSAALLAIILPVLWRP